MISWHSKQAPAENIMLLGQFDGVHLGHQALIKQATTLAQQQNIIATALLFNPLPRALLTPDFLPIQAHSDRLACLLDYGLAGVYELALSHDFLKLSPLAFIEQLQALNVRGIVVGSDFRFGYQRSGDLELLAKYFKLTVVPEIKYDQRRISSSWCRELILAGNFTACAQLLGRLWQFQAEFIAGKAKKPKILLPEINPTFKAKIYQPGQEFIANVAVESEHLLLENLSITGVFAILPF